MNSAVATAEGCRAASWSGGCKRGLLSHLQAPTCRQAVHLPGQETILDGLVMSVIQQAASVLQKGGAALPQPLRLMRFNVQHVQEGPVALWPCPSACRTRRLSHMYA